MLLLKRVLMVVPILFGVSVIVFFMLRLVPGDPAQVILGLRATPEGLAAIHRDLGLDLPIHRQYVHWLGNFLSGDLGRDYRSNIAVTTLLAQRLPVTVELTLLSILISTAVSIPLGVQAARNPKGLADRCTDAIGLVGISLPDFWLGIILILVFSLGLGVFPSSGYTPIAVSPVRNFMGFVLPSLTLAVGLAAVLVRVTRSAVLEVLSMNFVRFLRAKGLSERSIVYRHVLRNAALPIVTVTSMQFGYLLGGAVIVEQVFDLPGVGNLIVTATLERNFPIVQAGVLIVAAIVIFVNLVADLLYLLLNPRMSETDL